MTYDDRGSLWHRWDLHFHTPSSFDYKDGSVTNVQIVDRLIKHGIRAVAITDHHKIDVARIRELRKLGGNNLTVLPALELRDDHGGKPINYICIFPEDCDLDHVWITLQGDLGIMGCCRFQRHRVRCMNETGGEPWSDESLRVSSSWRR